MKCPKCKDSQLTEHQLDSKTKEVKCPSCGFREMRDYRGAPLLTEVPREEGGILLS